MDRMAGLTVGAVPVGFAELQCQAQGNTAETHTVTQIQALAFICCHVLNNLPVPALKTLFLGSGCSQHGHDGHPGARPA